MLHGRYQDLKMQMEAGQDTFDHKGVFLEDKGIKNKHAIVFISPLRGKYQIRREVNGVSILAMQKIY